MNPPLCVELFCGRFGWSAGWLALGGRSIGFDIEHLPHHGPVPAGAELVLQDVLTLHGRQFKDASLILCSPPCQEFSYIAMPWKRGKQIAKALRREIDERGKRVEFPEGYRGSRTIEEMTALFDACFRIQAEASAAAGHHIPMVVENVKGAQPWVGRANANFGSFYLWGDVRSVGGRIVAAHRVEFGAPGVKAYRGVAKVCGDLNWGRKDGKPSLGFNTSADAQVHGRKVPGMNFHEHEKTGKPGRSFQSAAVESSGVKQAGMSGPVWFDRGAAAHSSKSSARKAASAKIAEIPLELSTWLARCFKPSAEAAA